MANAAIAANYRVRVQAALAAAREACRVDHPGLQGQIREIVVRELLRPVLPPTFGVGRGKIVDSFEGQSGEVDVVIYNSAVLPPFLYTDASSLGLFPFEACVYAIEVKSTMTAASWKQAAQTAASVVSCQPLPDAQRGITTMVFAFDSDLTDPAKEGELGRWRKQEEGFSPPAWMEAWKQPLAVIYVVGQGYGLYTPPESYEWLAETEPAEKIMSWISGVTNSLFGATRQQAALPFGWYLMDRPAEQ